LGQKSGASEAQSSRTSPVSYKPVFLESCARLTYFHEAAKIAGIEENYALFDRRFRKSAEPRQNFYFLLPVVL